MLLPQVRARFAIAGRETVPARVMSGVEASELSFSCLDETFSVPHRASAAELSLLVLNLLRVGIEPR